MKQIPALTLSILLLTCLQLAAQKTVIVRPVQIDDVLNNPGIGFNTFQRFNGDELNPGMGGYPIVFQDFDGNLDNGAHPATTTAYFRIYWHMIEPERDQYRWDIIDRCLKTAAERGQTLILRIAPWGHRKEDDVPGWVRALTGESKDLPDTFWKLDPENPYYIEHFTDMVRDLGARYDGHPDLEMVDLSIVGNWGEGHGSELLTDETRRALVDSYIEAFRKTPLVMLLTDAKTNKYGLSRANVGWRMDCVGDMGYWAQEQGGWTHMLDHYPEDIINYGLKDAWKTAPVTFEACYVLSSWLKEGYDIDYIIDQTLKWHLSSFNNKSSAVPAECRQQVDRWLRSMGYRFVLRRFTYPGQVRPHGKLAFTSWWENTGVAPCYRQFPLAIRLRGEDCEEVLLTDANIRTWLPGDIVYDSAVFLPLELKPGSYQLDVAILDQRTREPAVKLAIEGLREDGWYNMGRIEVKE